MSKGSAGMGSKADMISSSFNDVERNAIWREVLKKEGSRTTYDSSNFRMDPNKLVALTQNPQGMDPTKLLSAVDSHQDTEDDQLLKDIIKKALRPPQEKSLWAATSSQEIGWFHKEGKARDRWFSGKNKCDETKYADSYVMMTQVSPYADKRGK